MEAPCFPPSAVDEMEESTGDEFDDIDVVPSTQMPEVQEEQEEDALRRAKGKRVVGSSSQPTGGRKTGLQRMSSQAEHSRPAAATQPSRLRRSSTQTAQRQPVDSEMTEPQPQAGRKSFSSSVLGKATELIGYRRLRKGTKSTEKHVSPTPQQTRRSSLAASKLPSSPTSGGGHANDSSTATPSTSTDDSGDQGQGEGGGEYEDNVQVVDVLGGGYVERSYGRYDDPQGEGHYEGSRQPSDTQPADSEFSSHSGTEYGTSYPYPQYPYPQQYPIVDPSSMGFGYSAMGYAYPQPPYQPEAAQSSSSEYHIQDQSTGGGGFFDFSFPQYYGHQRHDDDDDDNNAYQYGRFSSFN